MPIEWKQAERLGRGDAEKSMSRYSDESLDKSNGEQQYTELGAHNKFIKSMLRKGTTKKCTARDKNNMDPRVPQSHGQAGVHGLEHKHVR